MVTTDMSLVPLFRGLGLTTPANVLGPRFKGKPWKTAGPADAVVMSSAPSSQNPTLRTQKDRPERTGRGCQDTRYGNTSRRPVPTVYTSGASQRARPHPRR